MLGTISNSENMQRAAVKTFSVSLSISFSHGNSAIFEKMCYVLELETCVEGKWIHHHTQRVTLIVFGGGGTCE